MNRVVLVLLATLALCLGAFSTNANATSRSVVLKPQPRQVEDPGGGGGSQLCNVGTYAYKYSPTYGYRRYFCGATTCYQYAYNTEWWCAPWNTGLYIYIYGTEIPA